MNVSNYTVEELRAQFGARVLDTFTVTCTNTLCTHTGERFTVPLYKVTYHPGHHGSDSYNANCPFCNRGYDQDSVMTSEQRTVVEEIYHAPDTKANQAARLERVAGDLSHIAAENAKDALGKIVAPVEPLITVVLCASDKCKAGSTRRVEVHASELFVSTLKNSVPLRTIYYVFCPRCQAVVEVEEAYLSDDDKRVAESNTPNTMRSM